jgi:hypothetical protein
MEVDACSFGLLEGGELEETHLLPAGGQGSLLLQKKPRQSQCFFELE